MLVHGKVFTARRVGRQLKSVTCERCRRPFFYVLTRVGVGKGSAVYGIGQAGASQRASVAADANLQARLATDAEAVPCPSCHWVDAGAVDHLRSRMYRRASVLIGALLAATFLASIMVPAFLADAYGYRSRVPRIAGLLILLVGASSPAWVLLARRRLRERLDPNRTYPAWPAVPPATPPGLVEQRDPATGRRLLVPVPRPDPVDPAGGAVLRPGQLNLPAVCCGCLAAATTAYRPPPRTNVTSDLPVPLCDGCRRRLRWRWWRALLATAAVSIAAAVGLVLAIPGGDATGRWIVVCLFGPFVGLIAGVVMAGVAARPYRMTAVDRDRGITRFAAANPAYTALVAERAKAGDAAPLSVD